MGLRRLKHIEATCTNSRLTSKLKRCSNTIRAFRTIIANVAKEKLLSHFELKLQESPKIDTVYEATNLGQPTKMWQNTGSAKDSDKGLWYHGIMLSYKQKFWASKLLPRRLSIKAACRAFNVSICPCWESISTSEVFHPSRLDNKNCHQTLCSPASSLLLRVSWKRFKRSGLSLSNMALAGEHQHETSLDLKKGDRQHCDSRSQKNF